MTCLYLGRGADILKFVSDLVLKHIVFLFLKVFFCFLVVVVFLDVFVFVNVFFLLFGFFLTFFCF